MADFLGSILPFVVGGGVFAPAAASAATGAAGAHVDGRQGLTTDPQKIPPKSLFRIRTR